MPPLTEKISQQLHSLHHSEPGKIISPPESFWQPNQETEYKSPLEYKDGDILIPPGTKIILKEIGKDQQQKTAFIPITKDNFLLLLGVCTPRAETQGDSLNWHDSDAIELNYSSEEKRKRLAVREFIFQSFSEGKKLAVVRMVDVSDQYKSVSNGVTFKLQITSLIVAHTDQNKRELFELDIAVPQGIEKEDIFNLFQQNKKRDFSGEEALVLESSEDAPQFQHAVKIFEGLIIGNQQGQIGGNSEEIKEVLFLIKKRDEKGNIRPGKVEYEIINNRICAKDWRGRLAPIANLIDDKKAYQEWITFEKNVIEGGNGRYEFKPSGGVSAATSNHDPNDKELVNIFDREGDKLTMNVNPSPQIRIPSQIPPFIPNPNIRNMHFPNPSLWSFPQYPYQNSPLTALTEPVIFNPPLERAIGRAGNSSILESAGYQDNQKITPLFIFPVIASSGRTDFIPFLNDQDDSIVLKQWSEDIIDERVKVLKSQEVDLINHGEGNEEETNHKSTLLQVRAVRRSVTDVGITMSVFTPFALKPEGDGGGETSLKGIKQTHHKEAMQCTYAGKQETVETSELIHEAAPFREKTVGMQSSNAENKLARDAVGTYHGASLQDVTAETQTTAVGAKREHVQPQKAEADTVETHRNVSLQETQMEDAQEIQSVAAEKTESAKNRRDTPRRVSTESESSVTKNNVQIYKIPSEIIEIFSAAEIGTPVKIPAAQIGAIIKLLKEMEFQFSLEGFTEEKEVKRLFAFPQLPLAEFKEGLNNLMTIPQNNSPTFAMVGLLFLVFLNLLSGGIVIA